MEPTRILIAYYSRTGKTRSVAHILRSELGSDCDIEPIQDCVRQQSGAGYLRSVFAAAVGRPVELKPMHADPLSYDLVVVGTPVWSEAPAAPVRSFLAKYRLHLRQVAFFTTYTGTGSAPALRQMADVSGQSPLLTMDLRMDETDDRHVIGVKIRTFATALQTLAIDKQLVSEHRRHSHGPPVRPYSTVPT